MTNSLISGSNQPLPARSGNKDHSGNELQTKSQNNSRNDDGQNLNQLADKFKNLMKGKSGEPPSADVRQTVKDSAPPLESSLPIPQNSSMADAILTSMGKVTIAQPDKTLTNEQTKKFAETAEAICERILVSEKDISGRQEIRISLKNSILPDTEIRLFRDERGLNIKLVTSSAEARQFLNNRLPHLQDFLSQRIPDKIHVHITTQDQQDKDNAGDEERSRQRRNLYEEITD